MTQTQDVKNAVDISAIGATLVALTASVEDLKQEGQDRSAKLSENHRLTMAKFDEMNKTLAHQQGFINALKYVATPLGVVAAGLLSFLASVYAGITPPPGK